MTSLQQQARALGDPTRHTIFQYLADADEEVGVAELTSHLSLNHNAIRQHLAKLVDSGLVSERTAPAAGPGRPRLMYAVAPGADSRWGASGPYERLSLLLAEVIRTGDSPEVVGRRAGTSFRVAAEPREDAVADIVAAMAQQGFEPECRPRKDGAEVVLAVCPFASTALSDRQTVCGLHLGIAEGLAEDTDVYVDQLVARDPRRAGCRIRLRPRADEDEHSSELVLVGPPKPVQSHARRARST